MGIQSHIEADILWHWGSNSSTTEPQGYLQSMSHGASDCKDKWNEGDPSCHTDGDEGADFYDAGREGSDFLKEKWTIPTKDLSKIYAKLDIYTSTPEKIEYCTNIMYIGHILTKYYGGLLTNVIEEHTAFMSEELDLWF